MTIDEFVLELRSFEGAVAMPTARRDELVALFVRSDGEAGETQDQWVVLEADEDGGGIQLTRFFAFGDDDGDDLNDAGVVLDVEYEDRRPRQRRRRCSAEIPLIVLADRDHPTAFGAEPRPADRVLSLGRRTVPELGTERRRYGRQHDALSERQ